MLLIVVHNLYVVISILFECGICIYIYKTWLKLWSKHYFVFITKQLLYYFVFNVYFYKAYLGLTLMVGIDWLFVDYPSNSRFIGALLILKLSEYANLNVVYDGIN